MNSLPMRVATTAGEHDQQRRERRRPAAIADRRTRAAARRAARAARMNHVFVLATRLPVTSSATAAGTNVIDSSTAPRQRHEHRQRHRREHLSFDARQRQDRQIDDRDDQGAEQARP